MVVRDYIRLRSHFLPLPRTPFFRFVYHVEPHTHGSLRSPPAPPLRLFTSRADFTWAFRLHHCCRSTYAGSFRLLHTRCTGIYLTLRVGYLHDSRTRSFSCGCPLSPTRVATRSDVHHHAFYAHAPLHVTLQYTYGCVDAVGRWICGWDTLHLTPHTFPAFCPTFATATTLRSVGHVSASFGSLISRLVYVRTFYTLLLLPILITLRCICCLVVPFCLVVLFIWRICYVALPRYTLVLPRFPRFTFCSFFTRLLLDIRTVRYSDVPRGYHLPTFTRPTFTFTPLRRYVLYVLFPVYVPCTTYHPPHLPPAFVIHYHYLHTTIYRFTRLFIHTFHGPLGVVVEPDVLRFCPLLLRCCSLVIHHTVYLFYVR